jgi:hypothetical protein
LARLQNKNAGGRNALQRDGFEQEFKTDAATRFGHRRCLFRESSSGAYL